MTQAPSCTTNGLGGDKDRPFVVATFQRTPSRGGNQSRHDDDEDMPSNLMASRSNVPGMTPQELMAAHRTSLAEISKQSDPDLHSVTLSRHQVDAGDAYQASMGDIDDDEYRDALESFKFGEASDE